MAKKRFSLKNRACLMGFLALWLIVLVISPLRFLLQIELSDAYSILIGSSQIVVFPNSPTVTDFERLERSHPGDVRIWAKAAEMWPGASKGFHNLMHPPEPVPQDKIRLIKEDEVIARFPSIPWVVAERLRYTCVGHLGISARENDFEQLPTPSPYKRWLTNNEMLNALKCARQGSRIDPDNAFFDWMQAGLLFGLRRDEEALRALDTGSRKTRYDDGMRDSIRSLIEVSELSRPLLSEEKLLIYEQQTWPHVRKLMAIVQTALWRAYLAGQRGDHTRAIRIQSSLVRLGALMQSQGTQLNDALYGFGMIRSIWYNYATPPHRVIVRRNFLRRGLKKPSRLKAFLAREAEESHLRKLGFIAYMRRQGRPDLADETLHAEDSFDALKITSLFRPFPEGRPLYGVLYADMNNALKLRWVATEILLLIVMSATLWLILSLALCGRTVAVPFLDTAGIVTFCVCAVAVLLIASTNSRLSNDLLAILSFNPYWPGGSAHDLLVAHWFQKVLPWLPAVLSLVFCAVSVMWRYARSRRDSKIASDQPVTSTVTALALAVTVLFSMGWGIFLWDRYFSWYLSRSAASVNHLGAASGLEYFLSWLSFVPLMLLVCYLWKHVLGFLDGPIYYCVSWWRHSAAGMVLVLSVAYLVVSLASLPIRARIDTTLAKGLQIGEMPLMRQIAADAGIAKPASSE